MRQAKQTPTRQGFALGGRRDARKISHLGQAACIRGGSLNPKLVVLVSSSSALTASIISSSAPMASALIAFVLVYAYSVCAHPCLQHLCSSALTAQRQGHPYQGSRLRTALAGKRKVCKLSECEYQHKKREQTDLI
eukprot:scaffold205495_cov18-Tisochrysis_lutea.AAC.1